MQSHINYINSTNDYKNRVFELIDFRYKIYKNSIIVRARFRSLFIIYNLIYNRFNIFLLNYSKTLTLNTLVTLFLFFNNDEF